MRSAVRMILVRAVLPIMDSAILWAFGWRKEWVEGAGCGPHYVDPLDQTSLLLRDMAASTACHRARWGPDRWSKRDKIPALRRQEPK